MSKDKIRTMLAEMFSFEFVLTPICLDRYALNIDGVTRYSVYIFGIRIFTYRQM